MKELFIEKYNYIYKQGNFLTLPMKYMNESEKQIHLHFIEELLLSNEPVINSVAYNYIESLQNDKLYLKKYKDALKMHQKREEIFKLFAHVIYFPECLGTFKAVYNNIEAQSLDRSNRIRKMEVVDEYARVCRYLNDGVIRNDGAHEKGIPAYGMIVPSKPQKEISNNSNGVINNEFINFFSNQYLENDYYDILSPLSKKYILLGEDNKYRFTEKEIQDIYLLNHDEILYNQQLLCNDIKDINRPADSFACHQEFLLDKEAIYMDQAGNYLIVCPHCGTINFIEPLMLDEETKEQVKALKNPNLEKIRFNEAENIILKKKILKK